MVSPVPEKSLTALDNLERIKGRVAQAARESWQEGLFYLEDVQLLLVEIGRLQRQLDGEQGPCPDCNNQADRADRAEHRVRELEEAMRKILEDEWGEPIENIARAALGEGIE